MILKLCSVVSLINLWIQLIWLLTVCSYPLNQHSGGEIFQFHLYWITTWLPLSFFFFFLNLSCAQNKLYWSQKRSSLISIFFYYSMYSYSLWKRECQRKKKYWVCDNFLSLGIFLAKNIIYNKGCMFYIYA